MTAVALTLGVVCACAQEEEAEHAADAEQQAADMQADMDAVVRRAEAAEAAASRAESVLARLLQANSQLLRSHETSADAAAAVAQARSRNRLPRRSVCDRQRKVRSFRRTFDPCPVSPLSSQAATMLPEALHSMQQRFATPQAAPLRGPRSYTAASDVSVVRKSLAPSAQNIDEIMKVS